MSNSRPKKRRKAPFSIRLSESERAAILARAGGMPLGAYFKLVALSETAPAFRRPKAVVADHTLLGKALAGLGASRMASNLNQLAKQANLGSLPVTEETEADLRRACEEVSEIRALLLAALGIEKQEKPELPEPLRETFMREAAEVSA